MTDLKIDYQLPDEVRVNLGNLVAEFTAAQPVQYRYDSAIDLPGIVSALNRYAANWRFTGSS